MRLLSSFAAFALVLGVAACSESSSTAEKPAATKAPADVGTPVDGRVKIKVENDGYHPVAVQVKQGEEVTLEFTRVSTSPCGERVMVPDFGIDKELPLNKPVDINITPKATGTLAFMCGMKMMKGSIIVQ